MADTYDFFLRQGDTSPAITGVLKDAADQVVSLVGATVTFRAALVADPTVTIEGAATVDDAPGGEVSYGWQDGDTDTPGDWLAEWRADFGGGTVMTFPNGGYVRIRITDAVDAPAEHLTPTGGDLCTLEDIAGYVPAYRIGESDVTDAKLAQLITSQSQAFMEETGREIAPAADEPETRTFPIGRAAALSQRVWIGDLAELDSARLLEADGTLCEEIDVDTIVPMYGENRQPVTGWEPITSLTFPRAFSDRTELVHGYVLEVTGTWGFREIPAFVREAVAARVILRYVSDVAAAGTQFAEAIDSINAAALFAQARDSRLLVERVVLA